MRSRPCVVLYDQFCVFDRFDFFRRTCFGIGQKLQCVDGLTDFLTFGGENEVDEFFRSVHFFCTFDDGDGSDFIAGTFGRRGHDDVLVSFALERDRVVKITDRQRRSEQRNDDAQNQCIGDDAQIVRISKNTCIGLQRKFFAA